MKNDWKVGDKFIIDGPDEELDSYVLLRYKGTIQTVVSADSFNINGSNLFVPKEGGLWTVKVQHMFPLTKLHKALL